MRGFVSALGIISAQLLLACGGGGVEGEYVLQMGDSPEESLTLELLSDGKAVMTIAGMPPVQGAHSMEGDSWSSSWTATATSTRSAPTGT